MTTPRYRLRFATALVLFAALAGCAPPLVSPGADAASEQTTTDEVVDDDKIEIALNKLLADDSAELWKDVVPVVYRGRALEIVRANGDVVKVVNYVRVIEAADSYGCKKPPAPKRKPKS